MTIAELFPMFVLAAAIGALIGAVASVQITRSVLRDYIPTPGEQISVQTINFTCQIAGQDGGIAMQSKLDATYNELSAVAVEDWLKKRNLVMAPKGPDFIAKDRS